MLETCSIFDLESLKFSFRLTPGMLVTLKKENKNPGFGIVVAIREYEATVLWSVRPGDERAEIWEYTKMISQLMSPRQFQHHYVIKHT